MTTYTIPAIPLNLNVFVDTERFNDDAVHAGGGGIPFEVTIYTDSYVALHGIKEKPLFRFCGVKDHGLVECAIRKRLRAMVDLERSPVSIFSSCTAGYPSFTELMDQRTAYPPTIKERVGVVEGGRALMELLTSTGVVDHIVVNNMGWLPGGFLGWVMVCPDEYLVVLENEVRTSRRGVYIRNNVVYAETGIYSPHHVRTGAIDKILAGVDCFNVNNKDHLNDAELVGIWHKLLDVLDRDPAVASGRPF